MYSDYELRFLILDHLVDLSKKHPNTSVFSVEEIADDLKVDYKAVMFNIRYFLDKDFVDTPFDKKVGIPRKVKITSKGIDELNRLREPYLDWKGRYRTGLEISKQISEYNEIFDSLITNSEIWRVSEHGFKAGNYRNAIFDSYVKLEEMIKKKTNYPKDNKGREAIGVSLMHQVFDVKNPLLLWSPLRTQAERDEVEGFKYIFAGAMLGIKNPLSHQVDYQDPWRALNHIILANYLAYLVELAEYRSPVYEKTRKSIESVLDNSIKKEDLNTVRNSILADLEKNRLNLVGLFRSGGRDYLDHIFTLTTWNHFRSKLESFYPSFFSDFLEVYSTLEKLNEVIKMSVGTVDYSDPRFNTHKKLAFKTEKKIRALVEKLND